MSKLKEPIFYNICSSKTLGWDPTWFGCENFDEDLLSSIKKYQKEHKLEPDSLCGPATFKAINNEHQMKIELWKNQQLDKEAKIPKKNYILNNNTHSQIEYPYGLFVGMNEKDSLVASPNHYRSRNGHEIKMIVLHNDACLTSHDCYKVLERRNLSIHFMIDYTGTIYQSTDLYYSAQQAGAVNSFSIGVEVCNPVESKYNSFYTSKKLEPRPIIDKWVSNGKTYKKILGYYPLQISSLKQLLKVLCEGLNIPKIAAPTHDFYEPAFKGEFKGICSHYHVDPKKGKWDLCGVELEELVKGI